MYKYLTEIIVWANIADKFLENTVFNISSMYQRV